MRRVGFEQWRRNLAVALGNAPPDPAVGSALAAALEAYDALRARQKPRYPDVHGPAPDGCSWSENAARQLSVPERFGFRTWLRLRGFALD